MNEAIEDLRNNLMEMVECEVLNDARDRVMIDEQFEELFTQAVRSVISELMQEVKNAGH